MTSIHASAVAFGNKGVLIRGSSGSGKSDLVLRLIDGEGFGIGKKALRAKLVADDQVLLVRDNNRIIMSAPRTIAGKLEIRGIGIVDLRHKSKTKLVLVIDLKPQADIERMPELSDTVTEILGLKIRRIFIDPLANSAPAKIRALLC